MFGFSDCFGDLAVGQFAQVAQADQLLLVFRQSKNEQAQLFEAFVQFKDLAGFRQIAFNGFGNQGDVVLAPAVEIVKFVAGDPEEPGGAKLFWSRRLG